MVLLTNKFILVFLIDKHNRMYDDSLIHKKKVSKHLFKFKFASTSFLTDVIPSSTTKIFFFFGAKAIAPDRSTHFFPLSFLPRYLNAIQTNAHHLLRYLAIAVVVNKRRRNMLKDLIKVIQQEQRSYKDPVTEFLECLYVNYDFDGAQQKLMECDQVSLVLFLPNMTVVFIELHMYLLWMFKSLNGNVLHF